MGAEGNKMTTISIGIDIGWIYQHAKFYDIPFKRFVSKRGENSKCGEPTNGRTIIPISLNGSCISPKWFGHSTQTQAHVQLDGRVNTWNGNNTISINIGLMIGHLDTSACQILCHFSKWFVVETARLNRCYKTVEIKWSMSYPCLMIPVMSSSIRFELKLISALQWRHNGRDCASNRQPPDCLINRLFRRRSKKTSKLCVTGLCAGNSPVNVPHKWPVTRKMFPFDDVIMGLPANAPRPERVTNRQTGRRMY